MTSRVPKHPHRRTIERIERVGTGRWAAWLACGHVEIKWQKPDSKTMLCPSCLWEMQEQNTGLVEQG